MDLYGDLYFCKDSILRILTQRGENQVSYPLIDIQQYLGEDILFILKFFRSPTYFEKGTTLANAIIALEPWAKVISNYTDRNFTAYCNASKIPTAAKQEFSFLEISKGSYTNRHYDFEPYREGEDFLERLNRPDSRILTDYFDLESGTSMCGFNEGDNSNYSMSMDFDKIKHTPIVLTMKQSNIINDFSRNTPVIKKGVLGVKNTKRSSSFYSETSFNLEEILTAIFIDGLFYEVPQREEDDEALRAILDESARSVGIQLREESKPGLRLAASDGSIAEGFKEEAEENNDNAHEALEMKTVVAPGAFDSIIEHENEMADDWDSIYKALSGKSSIKENIEPAEREKSYRFEKLDK